MSKENLIAISQFKIANGYKIVLIITNNITCDLPRLDSSDLPDSHYQTAQW